MDVPTRTNDQTVAVPRSDAQQGIGRESFGQDPSAPKIIKQQEQLRAGQVTIHQVPIDGLPNKGVAKEATEAPVTNAPAANRLASAQSTDSISTDAASASALVKKNVLPDLTITDPGQSPPKETGGIGSVVGSVAKGAWDEVTQHPLDVLKKGAEGAAIGLALTAAGPEIAAAATVGGIVYGGYQIYQHGRDWLNSASVKANPEGHSPDEIAKANKELEQFGAGAVDLAAGGIGGGLSAATLRSGARSAASDIVSSEESSAAKTLTGSEVSLGVPKAPSPPVELNKVPPGVTTDSPPPQTDSSPSQPGSMKSDAPPSQAVPLKTDWTDAAAKKSEPEGRGISQPPDSNKYVKTSFDGKQTITDQQPSGNYTQVTVKDGETVTRQHEEFLNGLSRDSIRSKDGTLVRKTERNGDYSETRYDKDNVQVSPTLEVRGASDAFVNQVRQGINDIPAAHQKELAKFGAHFVVGRTTTQAHPHLENRTITNDPYGRTNWDQVDGHYDPKYKSISVSEFAENGVPNTEPAYSVLHEAGHGLDHARGNVSDSPEFQKAYQKDLRGSWLSAKEFTASKVDSAYIDYLRENKNKPSDVVGSEEAFAESYAAKYGSGKTENAERLKRFFPNSTRFFRENFE